MLLSVEVAQLLAKPLLGEVFRIPDFKHLVFGDRERQPETEFTAKSSSQDSPLNRGLL